MHSLATSYLGITQSTRTADSYSLGTSLNGAENRLFHGPPVGNTALDLFSYRFGYQIAIKLRLPNFLDIQSNPLSNKFLKAKPQFINSLSSPADGNTRPSSMDSYRYLFCLAVNLYQGDSCFSIRRFNSLPKLQVFMQDLGIMGIGIPLCLPILYDAKSKT